jgi:hypothetical protein
LEVKAGHRIGVGTFFQQVCLEVLNAAFRGSGDFVQMGGFVLAFRVAHSGVDGQPFFQQLLHQPAGYVASSAGDHYGFGVVYGCHVVIVYRLK